MPRLGVAVTGVEGSTGEFVRVWFATGVAEPVEDGVGDEASGVFAKGVV